MNMLDRLAERPGTAANAGLAVVFAAALAVGARIIVGYHRDWVFDLVVGVVVCTAALLRGYSRTWTAATGLTVCAVAEVAAWRWDLPGQPGGAACLALLVLIGSAARVLPVRSVVAVAAGGAVVAAGTMERYLTFIRDGTPSGFAATWIMGQGLVAALGVGLWLRLGDARRGKTIEEVRRGERLELARELHDAAAHHITGIVVQAQAARITARRHPETIDDALAGIESAGADALTSMRRVIGLLRDGDDAGGLTPGPEQLADLVNRFAGRGPDVRLRLPDRPAWPPEVTSTVYRVVQEALTNITRHAPGACEVIVAVDHNGQAITVEVTDDAPPGAPRFHHSGGYGLVGMRERVEALGGTLDAGPAPRTGWSVLATLPAPSRS
jgi:signal transduction histidine kinase